MNIQIADLSTGNQRQIAELRTVTTADERIVFQVTQDTTTQELTVQVYELDPESSNITSHFEIETTEPLYTVSHAFHIINLYLSENEIDIIG